MNKVCLQCGEEPNVVCIPPVQLYQNLNPGNCPFGHSFLLGFPGAYGVSTTWLLITS